MDPTSGQRLQPRFFAATAEEVELAVRLASEAFGAFRRLSGGERRAFLRKIATKIESIAGDTVERAGQETALPRARLQGETARTCVQLRLFADVARRDRGLKRVLIAPNPTWVGRPRPPNPLTNYNNYLFSRPINSQ